MFANGIDKSTSSYALLFARKSSHCYFMSKIVVRSFVIQAGKSKRCGNDKLLKLFLGHIWGKIIILSNFISRFITKFLNFLQNNSL